MLGLSLQSTFLLSFLMSGGKSSTYTVSTVSYDPFFAIKCLSCSRVSGENVDKSKT